MFVVAPYRTDAVARAFPWATVAILAVDLLVPLVLGFPSSGPAGGSAPLVDHLVLRWGRFEPWTWVTNVFVHLGWIHVLSNAVFLWVFGFVVEGLLGAPRFVVLYLAIAAGEGAVAQTLMLGADGGGAAGASGVVYGLMAIAALWSPRTRVITLVWIVTYVNTAADLPLLGFVVGWIAVDFGLALLGGFAMGTALLHLIGAGVGLAAGLWLLKTGRVDTEGWDWLSLRERDPRPRAGDFVGTPLAGRARIAAPVDPRVEALTTIRDRLEAGDPAGAAAADDDARRRIGGWRLPPGDRDALVAGLRAAGRTDLARPYLEEQVDAGDPAAVLALAGEAVRRERPTRALELLRALDPAALDPDARREHETLRAAAEALRAEGRLELE